MNPKTIVFSLILVLLVLVVAFIVLNKQESSKNSSVVQSSGISYVNEKIYTPNELWNNKNALLGSKVTVEGKIEIKWACTEVACSIQVPFCNGCAGDPYLEVGDGEDMDILYISMYGKNIRCHGKGGSADRIDRTSVKCNLLEWEKTYRLKGTLNKYESSEQYYLELEDYLLLP